MVDEGRFHGFVAQIGDVRRLVVHEGHGAAGFHEPHGGFYRCVGEDALQHHIHARGFLRADHGCVILAAVVDHHVCSEPAHVLGVRGTCRGVDARTQMFCDGNGEAAHAACSRLHQHALTCTELREFRQRLPRRECHQRQCGRLCVAQPLGLSCDGRCADGREFRVGSVLHRPGEREPEDLVAHLPAAHRLPDAHDAPRQIEAGHHRKCARQVCLQFPRAQAPIDGVHGGSGHLHQDFVILQRRYGQLSGYEHTGIAVVVIEHSSHKGSTPAIRRVFRSISEGRVLSFG